MAELAALGALLSSNLGTIGTIASGVGAVLTAGSTLAAGKQARQNAELEKAQLDIKAKEEQAASQREAEQYRRRKELALSQITNKAAASGFTATDPTTLAIADEVAQYGTVQEQMALYGGTSRRAGLEAQGQAALAEGIAKEKGTKWSAAATILGTVGTLADKYAPKRATASTGRYG